MGLVRGNPDDELYRAISDMRRRLRTLETRALGLGLIDTEDLAEDAVTADKIAPGEAWHYVGDTGEPAFENGWGNFATEPTHEDAKFHIDLLGYVHLAGMVDGGGPLGPSGSTIFALPPGYRPRERILTVTTSASTAWRLDIDPAGQVRTFSDTSVWVSLGAISFRAA